MIKLNLEVDEEIKTFDIPTNWSEVSVKMFMEIVKLDNSLINDLEKVMKLLGILTGMSNDEVEMLPVNEFKKIQEQLDFIKVDVERLNKESVMVDGVEYFVKNNFNELTMGESITIETLLKDVDNPMSILDKMLCIFLRKKKDDGKLETFKTTFLTDRVEMFRSLPISDVYNILVFFSSGVSSLENNMKDFLVNK